MTISPLQVHRPGALTDYRLLGRSRLRVSPLSLGAMTFGEIWGADDAESRRMFDHYAAAGGNFIDTADIYSRGRSEELIGAFILDQRESFVISTKFSFSLPGQGPNAGDNHRKNMMRAVEESLKRLRTDYRSLLSARLGFCHAGGRDAAWLRRSRPTGQNTLRWHFGHAGLTDGLTVTGRP